jgi:hypothetical protein
MIHATDNKTKCGCIKCGCLFIPSEVQRSARKDIHYLKYTSMLPELCFNCLYLSWLAREKDQTLLISLSETNPVS